MVYSAYYIIRSRPALQEACRGVAEDLSELLDPQLWVHAQGGRTTLTLADYIVKIKLLFLAHVRYIVSPSLSAAPPLGDLSIDEETFDRWWQLEVFDGEDWSTDVVADNLRRLERPELEELLTGLPQVYDRATT